MKRNFHDARGLGLVASSHQLMTKLLQCLELREQVIGDGKVAIGRTEEAVRAILSALCWRSECGQRDRVADLMFACSTRDSR